MRRLICILLIIPLTACMLSACGEKNSTDISLYEELAAEDAVLPSLDELGEYLSVQSLYHHDGDLFEWDAYDLAVKYPRDSYDDVKAAIEKKYTFEDDPITYTYNIGSKSTGIVTAYMPPSCRIDDFEIRMLDSESYSLVFPKDVYFIGFNDTTFTIVYTYFHDSDLDEIASLSDFLMDECGWKELYKNGTIY